MEESNRQKKIAGVLQKDVADAIQDVLRTSGTKNILVSVTQVHVTVDLSIAKVYLSVFPHKEAQKILDEINEIKHEIKHEIARLTRHQLRRMPELQYYIDDSLEYIEQIEKAVKGGDNPLEDPELLEKRRKK